MTTQQKEPSPALLAASRVVPTYVRPLMKKDLDDGLKYNGGCFKCAHSTPLGANPYQTIQAVHLQYNGTTGTIQRTILFSAVICWDDAYYQTHGVPDFLKAIAGRGASFPSIHDTLITKTRMDQSLGLHTRLYAVGDMPLTHNHGFVEMASLMQLMTPAMGNEVYLLYSGRWGSGVYLDPYEQNLHRKINIDACRFYSKETMRAYARNTKRTRGVELVEVRPDPPPRKRATTKKVVMKEPAVDWLAATAAGQTQEAITTITNNWTTAFVFNANGANNDQ